MLVMTTVYNVDSVSGILGDMSTGNRVQDARAWCRHVDPNRVLNSGLVFMEFE
jgi:hypothetical protein